MNLHIHSLPSNPTLDGISALSENIRYSEFNGEPLCMSMLTPCGNGRFPLLVFVQGSGWTKPAYQWELPQLSRISRRGFVVASVDHRSVWQDGGEAPGFLYDVCAAIRYLRKNAGQYKIDPQRVAIMGTSSGGNTSLMIGLTGGERRYDVGENLEYSSEVSAVVDCFGPTDLVAMVTEQYKDEVDDMNNIMARLAGGLASKNLDKLAAISPINFIESAKKKPPFLLMHGDADDCVLYSHTLAFHERLLANGFDSELYKIEGAPHEGTFWSEAVWEVIERFLAERV